jgi:hypothetical protein
VSARPDGEGCAVTVAAGGDVPAEPIVVTVNDACAVTVDREEPNGQPAATRAAPRPHHSGLRIPHLGKRRMAAAAAAMCAVVAVFLWRRKRPPA